MEKEKRNSNVYLQSVYIETVAFAYGSSDVFRPCRILVYNVEALDFRAIKLMRRNDKKKPYLYIVRRDGKKTSSR